MSDPQPEVWLRGPIPGQPVLLQPVAAAVLQAVEDVRAALDGFPDARLWDRPAGVASVGFHLKHLAGVLDRMTAYARGRALTDDERAQLKAEEAVEPGATSAMFVEAFAASVRRFLAYTAVLDPSVLPRPRAVGRKQLPSTMMGLLVHAAEHTTRHTGQLLVTARVVRALAVPPAADEAVAPPAPGDVPEASPEAG